uniref:Uncharacterized protein n=1 Tax=Candidatus Kentrum eta TaxID=2126337 RepID=A0A450V5A0_9GAMM|nr:MAG: hypothetical protein BECKH772A_GA0070896_100403 [Candidatus Kentron sp. H]VFJ93111.1 MAG: hypothetical protein BECKH772B_GA0070898_100393 [Candidatus Kentron sp. H]VFJ99973.1 MAG: hypothetical protein BECKH772C_GA0070978_100383 [Candidatus Kentron sp. H]
MVELEHPQLSVAEQCSLPGVGRSSYYHQSQPIDSEELFARCIDRASQSGYGPQI